MASTLTLRGRISPGPLRGKPLIEKNFYQLANVMGFEPFKGTLDIKISAHIDISHFATRAVDRILQDGTRHVDLYIAPVTIVVRKKEEFAELEEEIPRGRTLREKISELKKREEKMVRDEMKLEEELDKEEIVEKHDCFAIQEKEAINKSVIEIMDKISIKEKYGLKDGDVIDVIFYEKSVPKWRERMKM